MKLVAKETCKKAIKIALVLITPLMFSFITPLV